GTNTWPVTYQVLELVGGTFSVFMLVIITFYSGELVWRERDNRLDQIVDALPLPTWLPFSAKLVALMLVPVLLQAILLLCGLAIQMAKGYHHYELGQYVHELFGIQLVEYWLVCVLAIAVQSIVNQKYLGHFVMIVYFLAITFAGSLGFEHHLYLYGGNPGYTYSDMNGYGHFLPRLRWFEAYYAGWAVLLALAAYLLWTRGTASGWLERVRIAKARITRRVVVAAGVVACATLASGGFIYYNTNVLNHYRTAYDQQLRQADYEKKYRALLASPQPTITAVKLAVDIYPRDQRVAMRGSFMLVNHNDVPVSDIHLVWANGDQVDVRKLDFSTATTLTNNDMAIGVRSYHLAAPLAVGATLAMTFDIDVPTRGFANSGSNTSVVYNGSFVNGRFALPGLGYDERGELVDDRERKKFGLPPKERMRDRDDTAALVHNYLTHDADWITFEAEVSTEADQWAIAPGYLQREWVEGGRHHFLYRMDAPILDFFAFQSARYAVKRNRWNDVAIEVYYQPGHEYNLARMIAATKASLDYYTTNFGPYQYRQLRIVEFPRYATFAQSFPNTVPFSEGIGFIARVREDDKDDIDYPYYVTAHEVAHQWWAHQVIGADVQGATMLSETLAQYSALMVMKRKYGEARMQKFLAYELDRYLTGRATEQKKELPLARVENQPYIHYRKGSLVMYALADYIGEDNLNHAIREFRDANAFKGPPYPNTTQFLRYVRAATPPRYQYLIDDMFESITLYDNRALKAEAVALPDGHYAVTLEVTAKKIKADGLGKESDATLADWIDIGVLDADGKPLYLDKRQINQAANTYTLEVAGKPARAGIDPLNKLIDRNPRDNTIPVTLR
ncbi:MAG: M1 family aminopeptidase, partial [Casimicrobiaceae bacterium]